MHAHAASACPAPPRPACRFQAIAAACRRLHPDVLLLTSFVQMSGAAAIPRLLGLRTRTVVAHCIPMRPTAEFSVGGWVLVG